MQTILIVDDEERIRNAYGRLFIRNGFEVILAANAMAAKEMLVTEKIDLVLLDINMAPVDGSTLFETMRAFHKNVKVIVSSVYSIEDQKQLIESAADYFDKSDSVEILLKKVRFHLQGTGGYEKTNNNC